MKKLGKILVLNLLIIVSLVGMIGCSSAEKIDSGFGLEQFENEMKAKGYTYKRQDLQEGLLTPITQFMLLDSTDIRIYSYKDNEEMEKEASTIREDGCGITRGKESIAVDWTSKPHFYKKGNIIVHYVGEDEKIISDIEEIMGEQFAGIK